MTRVLALLAALGGTALAAPCLIAEDPGKPQPAQDTTAFEMTAQEKELLGLTNQARAKEKLAPLKPSPLLFKVARAHSANMARQGKMEHVLDSKNPAQRAMAGGYDYAKVAENIAWADSEKAPVREIVQGWLNSKAHRDNLLDRRLQEIGLGIARNDKGEVYFTQLFGTPRKKRPPRPPQDDPDR
jgi:uncharacterized protein YkwD